MGHKHSKPSENPGGTGSTRATKPKFHPPGQQPPAYDNCDKTAWLPRENVLLIIENINIIMKEVVGELDNELDGSSDVLVASGHIRESCTVAARTVTKTMLPNITHKSLASDLYECSTRLEELSQALVRDVAVDKEVAVILISANAVTKAAYMARSTSKDYRTGTWAAVIGITMHRIGARIASRKYKSLAQDLAV
ncbi:unnamed protein product [Clonostachys rhizophaga]|uniref:Uncharacterized protein n=1 Tax=Clonostachys rhizophaga TaxID=160324 RepID=A0A9N9V8L8_9HYPO|nr:unnamed protein product [Clonostachys rhizophaga]